MVSNGDFIKIYNSEIKYLKILVTDVNGKVIICTSKWCNNYFGAIILWEVTGKNISARISHVDKILKIYKCYM